MGKLDKIREQVLSGSADNNLALDDLILLARSLNLNERTGSKHPHIFTGTTKDNHPIFLNLQSGSGNQAKPYQVKQLRRIIKQHEL